MVPEIEDKFEAGARVLLDGGCDLGTCADAMLALGLESPEVLRLHALVPIACGRVLFQTRNPSPKYADHYVVTNNGRTRIEVPYATCPAYTGIVRALAKSSRAQIAYIGAFAGETRAINDVLNKMDQQGLVPDLGRIKLQPTEVLY